MRFFGSKLRESYNRKRDGQQHHTLAAASSAEEVAELRTTDGRNKNDHGEKLKVVKTKDSPTLAFQQPQPQLQPQALSSNPNLNPLPRTQHQPTTTSEFKKTILVPSSTTATILTSTSWDGREGKSPGGIPSQSRRATTNASNSSSSSKLRGDNHIRPKPTTTAPILTIPTTSSPESRTSLSPKQAGSAISSMGMIKASSSGSSRANAPTSILHRKKQPLSPTTKATASSSHTTSKNNGQPPKLQLALNPPSSNEGISQLPVSHNPRVRFMSAGSVASTETSQVHLMAGAAGSVASSSAMSSAADNPRDNVFDRVLHMVMAEENERLNAMGMSPRADPKSDVVVKLATSSSTMKMTSTSAGGREDITSSTMMAVAGPIDVDTGARVEDDNLGFDTSIDVEYHDRIDDDDDRVHEERWTRLNDTAIASGMQDLAFDSNVVLPQSQVGSKRNKKSSTRRVDDLASF